MNQQSMQLLVSLLQNHDRLQDIVVLHINHCMDNSFYFTEQLLKVFDDAVFIAVPYNDRPIPKKLNYSAYHASTEKNGYVISRDNIKVEYSEGNFLHTVERMIRLVLENEISQWLNNGKRLLIIEDGGYHYQILREWLKIHPEWSDRVIGAVEQTTAGTRAAQLQSAKSISYPVISVARSSYKTRIEAYFVAERVVEELQRMLRDINTFISFHGVLLIGYGVIGRSIAGCLDSHQAKISVYDTDQSICETAKQDGISLWNGEFCENMIVLGNVGQPSFTSQMLSSFLKGKSHRIFLASSSSKQIEFQDIFHLISDAEHIVTEQAEIFRFPNHEKKEIVLLAKGFPLNFYNKSGDSLTYSMIDPVFSEMLSGAFILCEMYGKLQNKTYLFGSAPETGGQNEEYKLLSEWMKINGLHIDINEFNRHPNEKLLRNQNDEG